MIYDLSEQISEKIDAASIANIALKEASQIIDSSHGLFLMHDPDEDQVVEMSSFGENPDNEQSILSQNKILKELKSVYSITNIVGHSDIAPGRKFDPGENFDWERVADV